MAYQNVGTPRFYINSLEWGASVGFMSIDPLFRTLPVGPSGFSGTDLTVSASGLGNEIPFLGEIDNEPRDFVAYLGHDFGA